MGSDFFLYVVLLNFSVNASEKSIYESLPIKGTNWMNWKKDFWTDDMFDVIIRREKKISKMNFYYHYLCFGNVSMGAWDGCKKTQGLEEELKNLMV